MISLRTGCTSLSLIACAALSASSARAQVAKMLSAPPGSSSGPTYAQSIDGAGRVVGYYDGKPMLWSRSDSTYVGQHLALPPGAASGGANFISSGGAIAGYTQPSDQSTATATVWTAPPSGAYAPTLLPSPPTAVLTDAYSVNDSGDVGGYFENASAQTAAVVWTAPAVAGGAYSANVLPKLAGWTDTAATTINNLGHVAGYAFGHPVDGFHAAVWEKNGSTYTPKNVLSADSALITAMNDYGTGVGVYAGDQPLVMVQYEGDYYAGELDVPFGTSDGATNAVNNHDALVGYLKDPTTATSGAEAALWLPTETSWELVNLDKWLDEVSPISGAQWTLMEAFGISDNWLVTGHALYDGRSERAFVLDVSSLVPEPAGVLAALCVPLLLTRRRRH